jgi:hypothetical protein
LLCAALWALAPASAIARPGSGPLDPCELFESGAGPRAPVARSGPFRAAFAHLHAGRWKAAAGAFDRAADAVSAEVVELFQADAGPSDRNARIREFLDAHFYGREPLLVLAGDDFRFVAAVYLGQAEARCHIGDAAGALGALAYVEPQDDPRLAVARAAVALAESRPGDALAALQPPADPERLRVRLARGMAHAALGQPNDAARAFEAAQRECAGPAECSLVARAREAAALRKETR